MFEGKEISRLPILIGVLEGTEIAVIVHEGVTKQVNLDFLRQFFSQNGGNTYVRNTPTPISVGGVDIGETFSGTTQDALDKLFYPFVNATFNATANPNLFEKGTTASIVVSGSVTENSDTFLQVRIIKSGATLLTSNNPNFAYTDFGINSPTTYLVEVSLETEGIITQNVSVNYVAPSYRGVGNQNLTASQIQTLTKSVVNKGNRTYSFTGNNIVPYYAFPQSFGLLTSIIDQNNFNTILDWELRTENFILNDGTNEMYHVYEFSNLTNISNFQYSFNF